MQQHALEQVHSLQPTSAQPSASSAQEDAPSEEVVRLRAENRALEARIAQLEAAHEARIEDIAVLVRAFTLDQDKLIAARLKEAEAQIERKPSEPNSSQATLDEELARVTAERDALLASTSWRITAPLRKLTLTFLALKNR